MVGEYKGRLDGPAFSQYESMHDPEFTISKQGMDLYSGLQNKANQMRIDSSFPGPGAIMPVYFGSQSKSPSKDYN